MARAAIAPAEARRLLWVASAFLFLRIAFLLLLYRFSLGQLVAYVLMPELFFYLCFVGSFLVAGVVVAPVGAAARTIAPAPPEAGARELLPPPVPTGPTGPKHVLPSV